MPSPLGEPVDPLPMVPEPREVGLVPGLVPDTPLPLPFPAPLDAGGQSVADLPEPTFAHSVPFEEDAPALVSPVEPPLPEEEEGVFGSTELPVPSVRALVPEVEGVDVCASEIPAPNISATINDNFFIFPPTEILFQESVQVMCPSTGLSCTHFQYKVNHGSKSKRQDIVNAAVGQKRGKQLATRDLVGEQHHEYRFEYA